MARRRLLFVSILALGLAGAAPVAAGSAVVRIHDVPTVVVVAMPDDFPAGSLMRAHCDVVQRVERPDGSAVETAVCRLATEPPLMNPANQGQAPARTFIDQGGACIWTSDYWWTVADEPVYADAFRVTVTPAGLVHYRATYPARPLDC